MRSLLIIFVKNPALGKVKTRLANTVGETEALNVYNKLLHHTLQVTKDLACDKAVFYSDFIDENDNWKHFSYKQYMQQGYDLGERMENAFQWAFREKYEQVVIIGSDCMELSPDIINKAFLALDIYGAVVGPANDGGYYLLGMKKMIRSVFRNKAWSSDNVFANTIQDLQSEAAEFTLLPVLNDIDTAEDWENYQLVSSSFAFISRSLILLFTVLIFSSCISTKPYYSSAVKGWQTTSKDTAVKAVYSVYLIGDAGMPKYAEKDTLKSFLHNYLSATNTNSSIVFMGDNIYPAGMPPQGHKNRAKAENSIASQLEILQGYKGKVFFIPGNHDWNQSRQGGQEYIIREAEYLEKSKENQIIFLPDSACPGPVDVVLQNNIVLLLIDSEWWLHKHDKPYGNASWCNARNEAQFEENLKQLLEKYKDKQVIIAAHHPVFSNGTHGGYFPLKDHVFPLAAFKKNLYFPLPVLGSIYTSYRKYFGHRQDIPNRKYSAYNKLIINALAAYKNVIYAAGHEHNLQYFYEQNNHYIVSGSGSKSYYVKRKGKPVYAHNVRGFSAVKLYNDNSVWLEYWGADKTTGEVKIYFKKMLK